MVSACIVWLYAPLGRPLLLMESRPRYFVVYEMARQSYIHLPDHNRHNWALSVTVQVTEVNYIKPRKLERASLQRYIPGTQLEKLLV
jgi:hypothetical protein